MIYTTSTGMMRRRIIESDLGFNLLRICSRQAYTLWQLIRERDFVGIDAKIHSMRTELSVTASVSDTRHQGLLTRIGLVQDPIYPRMHAELLRTSLLAFVVCPELAYAESEAYATYLDAWFALSEIREDLGTRQDWVHALFLAFPELVRGCIYATQVEEKRSSENTGEAAKQIFGWYRVADLATHPNPPRLTKLLVAVRHPPLPSGYQALQEVGTSRNNIKGLSRFLLFLRLKRPPLIDDMGLSIAPLHGAELHAGRLRPTPPTQC